jgi:hypothetical protein
MPSASDEIPMHVFPMRFRNALSVGTELAIEIPASHAKRRSWVQILPHNDAEDLQAKREGWRRFHEDRDFTVLTREFAKTHIENNWDVAPGDGVWDVRRADVHGITELEALLRSWGVNVAQLAYSADTDSPF